MRQLNRFLLDVAAPALFSCWIVYMGFAAVAGASGWRALAVLAGNVAVAEAELKTLVDRRKALERRADMLNPRSLDSDMVDESIRTVLGFAHEEDLVLPRDELRRLAEDRSAEDRLP